MNELSPAERKKHIEDEATFKQKVLSGLEYAKESRERDTQSIHSRIERMETKHTDTYKDVFTLIGKNATQIATMAERVEGVKDDVKDDVKGSIKDLEDDVKKVGRKSGIASGTIASAVIKAVEKGLETIGISL